MRRVALHNLGCKVNAYETEAMEQRLEEAGYEIVSFQEEADVYIINTCSVTNIADRKSRQMLHKAKKKNPSSVVVAVGCYVQAAKESLKDDPSVDLMIGNNKKIELIEILEDYFKDFDGRFDKNDVGYRCRGESETVEKSNDLRRLRVFKTPYGKEEFFGWHISFAGNFPGRIHFIPDAEHRLGIVGYIGKHLPTGKFSTI